MRSKSINWFLNDNGLRHERVNVLSSTGMEESKNVPDKHMMLISLTFPVANLVEEKKLSEIFIITLLFGGSKDFMKALIKLFETQQRSVKIKI